MHSLPASQVASVRVQPGLDPLAESFGGAGALQVGGARKSTSEAFVAGCVISQAPGERAVTDRGNDQVVSHPLGSFLRRPV